MPEDCTTESDLERLLDDLEDFSLNASNYQTLQGTLDSVNHITATTAEKLLLLCIRDRIEYLKYAPHVLNIIATLLKKIKDGQCTSLPNLVPSALAVINVLKTTAPVNKCEVLKTLCFEIINSYPDETLISLVENHSDEILNIIKPFCDSRHIKIPEIVEQLMKLLAKLLRILPPDKKATFVKDGIDTWFSVVIPLVVKQVLYDKTVLDLLETLELLTDELVQFDYVKNTNWQEILENIQTPSRYPTIMKCAVEKGSPYWHRLWIVFIKLLKGQLTVSTHKSGSPLNALLTCVEAAFKMDVRNRCRAYLCWNVLIETFSSDKNEAFLNKGVKLLMVPLTSNNAKVEETALAKFKTWWYLITCFQIKIDAYLESILIPFLTFCFGKPSATVLIPGMISDKMKVQCTQAFINIIGHSQCEGCVALPKLNVNLFKTSLLVKHWKEWFHSISIAIRTCVEQNSEFTEKQIRCLWKSFIMTIGELSENNVRRDLYNEALRVLEGFTQDCDIRLMGAIVNVLIPTLFDENEKIQALLKSIDEQNAPVCKIITVLNKLPLDNLEDRKIALESIKAFTNWMVDDALKTSSTKVEHAVRTLPCNGMLLWTALAESMTINVQSMCPTLLTQILLWPFKFMNNFVNKEESTTAWLNLYKNISPYLQIIINKDIVKALMTHSDSQSSCVFVLRATIVVLEHKLQQEDPDFKEEIELILQLTSTINEVQIKLILPSLASVISCTLTALSKIINVTIAKHVMLIINNILKICNVVFQQQFDDGTDLVKYIENIFNSLESTLKLDFYAKLKSHLVDQLKKCAPYLKHDKSLNNHILAIYKTSFNKSLADNIAEEVVQAFKIVNSQKADPQKITAPSGKTAKKSKMGPSITNTVVENGEEFVVVKSNWKFNPRKLTENQKEKLQRKREDIPAMYQDLSQSQDDFKLNTWKTDSQDTSTTSSKSTNVTANEDVSVILKNMPNSEFLPKIIENVCVNPPNKTCVNHVIQDTEPSKETLNVTEESENSKIKNVQNTVKDVKSPRMALKDRVFRNVRSLIERSKEQECKNNTVDILRTPLFAKVKPSTNITNSAPSQINSDRPSRMKRKPKKFDDLELISIRKRRHSLGKSDFQEDVEMAENQVQEETVHSKEANIVTEDKDKAKLTSIRKRRQSLGKSDSQEDVEIAENQVQEETVHSKEANIVTEDKDKAKLTSIRKRRQSLGKSDSQEDVEIAENQVQEGTVHSKEANIVTEDKDKAKLTSIRKRRQSLGKSDSQEDVEIAENQVQEKTVHSKEANIVTEDKDKAKLTSIRKRRQSLGKSDSQEHVEMAENQVQEETVHSKEANIVTEDKDKAKLTAIRKRRQSLGKSDSQEDVEMAENQVQQETVHSKEANIVTEDKDKAKLTSIRKRRQSLGKSDSQEDVEMAENQVQEKKVHSKETKIVIEDKDKAKHVDSQELIDKSTDYFTVVEEDINTLERHGNNKLREKLTVIRECFVAAEKLNPTNDVVNRLLEKEREAACLDAKNKASKSVYDKIKEKVEEKICTDDTLDKVSSTPNVNKSKDKSEQISTDSKKKVLFLPKTKTEESNENKKIQCDESKCDAVPTPMDILSSKKSNRKKSRIESQLEIDMVEGHPFLEVKSAKRLTRNAIVNNPLNRKRLSFNADNNKLKRKGTTKAENKTKDKEKSILIKDTPNSEDISASQDFIESSQESTVTTISVQSPKPIGNKIARVILKDGKYTTNATEINAQNLLDVPVTGTTDLTNIESNSDIELPCNKTNLDNLTEDMDTEPIDYAVIVLSEDVDPPLPVISKVMLEPDTQNTADADTQPVDPDIFLETFFKDKPSDANQTTELTVIPENNKINGKSEDVIVENNDTNASLMTTGEDITKTLSESVLMEAEKDDSSSSCNNDQRKKEFLNSTLQISPIKSMSPVRNEKSPSPETSSEFVVIKLVSPVQSNGQPFEICESLEIFTEDKVSPDKRDRSPPREEVCAKNTSPSSSLSLKKNRSQMRPGGRAAQMLELCVPDRLQTVIASEKPADIEEVKRSPSTNTSAKRNLRILYNKSDDTENSESFLQLNRTLPTIDCSPGGPILKRKLIDITDETTASPASKKKRVSFNEPLSTTVCVKKYIAPIGNRSPLNSANKRTEKQARAKKAGKSPRKLENAFKLDSVLTKAVESFSEASDTQTLNGTDVSSMDETPVVEVVKTSDLNDTDPICEELVDCEDQISNIAADLSSPAMQASLVKTFEGKVETIGDLAKMTELEVNRLCIKAPKVQVVKKVLNEYLSKLKQVSEEITPTIEAAMSESTVLEAATSFEVQTDESTVLENAASLEVQTDKSTILKAVASFEVQTDESTVLEAATGFEVQTDESTVLEATTSFEVQTDESTVLEAATGFEVQTEESTVLEAATSFEVQTEESTVLEAPTSCEVQTDPPAVESIAMQTERLAVTLASSQTDAVEMSHIFVQTDETGSKSTADIITDCIAERSDFIERLCENIDEPSKEKIVENLPYDTLVKIIMDKLCNGDGEPKDLIRLCSSLLNKAYDKLA